MDGRGMTLYTYGHDKRNASVCTDVCARAPEVAGVHDVTVALPRLVGGQGVLETFPLPLDGEETAQLHDSAGVIRRALGELGEGP